MQVLARMFHLLVIATTNCMDGADCLRIVHHAWLMLSHHTLSICIVWKKTQLPLLGLHQSEQLMALLLFVRVVNPNLRCGSQIVFYHNLIKVQFLIQAMSGLG